MSEHNAIAQRVKDARDIGAVAGGMVDCSAAFQAMAPYIEIPFGIYSLEHGLISGQTFSMKGSGRETSYLFGRSSLPTALLCMDAGGFHIRDLTIVMQNGYPAIQGIAPIVDGLLQACWLSGEDVPSVEALFSAHCANVVIHSCTFERASHAIRIIGGQSAYVFVLGGTVFWDVRNTVLEFYQVNGINLSDLFIEARLIEDVNSSAVVLRDCTNINISNVVCSKTADAPADSFLHAFHLENCDNVNISNVVTDGFCSGTPFEIVNSTRIYRATMEVVA